jgi:hypothetical protein
MNSTLSDGRFSYSSNTTVTVSTILEATVLILLFREIYVGSC